MSKLIFNKINYYIKQSQEELEIYKLTKNINLKKIELFTKILEIVREKDNYYYNEFYNNYLKYYKFINYYLNFSKNIYDFIDIINHYMYNEEIYNEIKNILDTTPKPIYKYNPNSKNKKKSISLVLRKKV